MYVGGIKMQCRVSGRLFIIGVIVLLAACDSNLSKEDPDIATTNTIRLICADMAGVVRERYNDFAAIDKKGVALIKRKDQAQSQRDSTPEIGPDFLSQKDIELRGAWREEFQYWTARWEQLGCSQFF